MAAVSGVGAAGGLAVDMSVVSIVAMMSVQKRGMETFTLVVWLYVGQVYEEVRVPKLTDAECVELVVKVFARTIGHCVGRPRFPVMPDATRPLQCAACGRLPELPPGRKRV